MMRSASVLSTVAIVSGVWFGACGGGDHGDHAVTTPADVSEVGEVGAPEDTSTAAETALETTVEPDTVLVPETAVDPDTTVDPETDADADEVGETLDCDGNVRPAGCPCVNSDDCEDFCVTTDLGKRCVSTCTESCPSGFACILASVASADPVFLCLPRYAKLCQPCREHIDCQAQGDGQLSLCLDYGVAGHFCGGYCDDDTVCPSGYACADQVLGDGSHTKQCVRNDNVCECNDLGKSLSMATGCEVANALGTCAGERTCGAAGLGACDALAAVPETCDRMDNDCNGVTDDLAADVPCTNDNDYGTCRGIAGCTGGVPVCVGPIPAAESCNGLDDNCNGATDDGYADLDADHIADCVDPDQDGDNTKDTADNCPRIANADQADNDEDGLGDVCDFDDDNDSGPDSVDCDPFDSTVHTGATEICDGRDNDCDHATDEGLCDDAVDCTFDYCIPASGECGHVADDTACDDTNACTTDICDVKTGCDTEPLSGTTCEDNDLCTTRDRCLEGACIGDAVTGCCAVDADCDDQNPCTRDACDPTDGTCSREVLADETPCDADANGCTVDDSCQSGTCVAGLAPQCSVVNPCAVGSCESQGANSYACVQTYRDRVTACDDGLFCTSADHCNGQGACVGGGALDCGASESGCQIIVCDEVGDACEVSNAAEAQACSDGDGCTRSDACHLGACVGGGPPDCSNVADACNDGACDALDADHYQCVKDPVPRGVACASADFCVVETVCNGAGACGVGVARDCALEVGDQCNGARCDSVLARCVRTPVADKTSCDDGNSCTQIDTCKNGVCSGAGDACVEEQVSTGADGNVQPTIVGVGYGRYQAQWWTATVNTAQRSRLSDAHGSRENEEVVSTSTGTSRPATWSTRMAAQPNGDHVIIDWTGGTSAREEGTAQNPGSCGHTTTNTAYERGTAYDYLGVVVNQANLWPMLQTAYSAGTNCNGSAAMNTIRVVPLPFSTGFAYVGSADGTTSMNSSLNPPANQISYYPPTGPFTVGARITLVAAAQTTGDFDARHTTDGQTKFVAAWVAANGTDVLARRFGVDGQPDAAAAWAVVSAGSGNTVSQVRVATFTDSKFIVVWEVDKVDTSGRGVYARRFNFDGTTAGDEFLVNTNRVGSQGLGEIGVFADNSFVIAYDDANGDADGYAVKAQRYQSNGTAIGTPLTVNTIASGAQYRPTVAVLDTGEWVVGFVDGASKVWTRRFFKDGTPSIGQIERVVNDVTAGAQRNASAARAANGNMLVVYESPVVGLDAGEVLGKLLDAQGRAVRPEFRVNTYTTLGQVLPRVAAASDRFVVAWESLDQDGSAEGVYAQLLGADGVAVGGEFRVNTSTNDVQRHAAVAAHDDGTFMIVWAGYASAGGSVMDVFGAIYGRDGQVVKSEFALTTTTAGAQDFPVVVADPTTGGFLVGWQSYNQDTSNYGVYLRRFSAGGAALSGEVQAHSTIAGDQVSLALAIAPTGAAAVGCWESYGQDVAATWGVYCQRFGLADLSKAGAEWRPHAVTAGDQGHPAVAYLEDGDFVVGWDSAGVDGAGLAAQYQRYAASGETQGARVVANRTWAGDQSRPFFAVADGSGGFLVGWQSAAQDGSDLGIYFRLMPGF